jgi:DNA invertase Pin-like site-specific DNA recombinase
VKIIAYLRISTADQDCDNQRLAILDYAHQHKMTIDEFVSMQVSSRKTLKQRGILKLLDSLEPEDILLVSELSRLGRSVGQIIQMVDYLVKNQIRLVAIKESIELSGKQDIPTKVMITMFSLFAEIERDLISERTKEGIAAARARGKVIGRPKGALGKSKLDGKEVDIQLLLKKEVGIASIAKIMGVSRTALRHFIRTRKLS